MWCKNKSPFLQVGVLYLEDILCQRLYHNSYVVKDQRLTVGLETDGNGVHERKGAPVVQLVPATFLADDDLIAEHKDETTSFVFEARSRRQLVYLRDNRPTD